MFMLKRNRGLCVLFPFECIIQRRKVEYDVLTFVTSHIPSVYLCTDTVLEFFLHFTRIIFTLVLFNSGLTLLSCSVFVDLAGEVG